MRHRNAFIDSHPSRMWSLTLPQWATPTPSDAERAAARGVSVRGGRLRHADKLWARDERR